MKLNEVYKRPLWDVIAEMDLADLKVHTDEDGTVKSVELKYVEKAPEPEETGTTPRS